MKGNLLVYILLLFCCVHTSAQTVEIVGEVEDAFLQVPLSGVRISILIRIVRLWWIPQR